MSTLSQMVLRDVIANRPAASIAGRLFYATDTSATYRDNGSSWDLFTGASGSGNTASRPAFTSVGAYYYDTTLNIPVWWDGANWRNASGVIA